MDFLSLNKNNKIGYETYLCQKQRNTEKDMWDFGFLKIKTELSLQDFNISLLLRFLTNKNSSEWNLWTTILESQVNFNNDLISHLNKIRAIMFFGHAFNTILWRLLKNLLVYSYNWGLTTIRTYVRFSEIFVVKHFT